MDPALVALPAMARDLLGEWSLSPDGGVIRGGSTLVLPVRTEHGRPAVLKMGADGPVGDPEAAHEHVALQHWHGRGAVELLRADPRRRALLLERLHRDDLTQTWDLEACEVVAGLYTDLHRPAPPQLRRLSDVVGASVERLALLPRDAPVPRRLVEQTLSLGRGFAMDDACDGRIVHTDLHYGNVLAADRTPWLAIGPKPLSGDPHYEVAPLLWNRWQELAGDVRGGLRRRFHATIDAAGFDEDRARDWVVVRMMQRALQSLESAGAVDREWVTRCVTIAKAVQE